MSDSANLNETVTIGQFELVERIGQGGMAEVWRSRHLATGTEAAIKLMSGALLRDPRHHIAFANEVRAVAALDHPGIIRVLDYGAVTAQEARNSRGRFAPGIPFLVMELANGGPVDRQGVATWTEVRDVLLQVLDGLAHAHARGVVHRDLKPGNLLRISKGAERARIVLTDFGIAHALDGPLPSAEPGQTLGTPNYMAPEQITARWSELGPWTDLYALGCVALHLLEGRPPFADRSPQEVMRGHLLGALPALEPRMATPSGLPEWLAGMLARSVAQRFRCAADASYALRGLAAQVPDDQTEQTADGASRSRPASSDTASALPKTRPELAAVSTDAPHQADESPALESRRGPPPVAPFQTGWREPAAALPSLRFEGAGLSLYGLRTPPFVGRDRDRELLWQQLALVHQQGQVRVVVIQGPSGRGKSRLARWLAERAHETGAAHVMHAFFGPLPGPLDGLPRMVAADLAWLGLRHEAARAQLDRQSSEWELSPSTAAALLELAQLGPASREMASATLRLANATERYAALRSLVAWRALERPVLLWFDDVQWGLDALRLTQFLLQAPQGLSALVVMTARDDALPHRPAEAGALEELLAATAVVQRIALAPLRSTEHLQLVQRLLHLEPALAQTLARRTEGHPLLATQLVGDLVQRDLLDASPDGFRLRKGVALDVPSDVRELWEERRLELPRQVHTMAAEFVVAAVEMAAALGLDVDQDEWTAACEQAGIALDPQLVEVMAKGAVIVPARGGWSFAHNLLRDAIEESARRAGRWPRHNRMCALMLQQRFGDSTAVAARVGRHLLEANRTLEALPPLLNAADAAREQSDYEEALGLLDLRDRAVEVLELRRGDLQANEGRFLRARVQMEQGRVEQAHATISEVVAATRLLGHDALLARALWLRGGLFNRSADLDDSTAAYEEAFALFQRTGDTSWAARCLYGSANARLWRGDLAGALPLYERAIALLDAGIDAAEIGSCRLGRSWAFRQADDVEAAIANTQEALRWFQRAGNRYGVASALNDLGESARMLGDLGAAEEHYREGLRLMEAVGSRDAAVIRGNLGIVCLRTGRWEEARHLLVEAEAQLGDSGQIVYLATIDLLLLLPLAHAGQWSEFARRLASGAERIAHSGLVDDDLAWAAGQAAELARRAGQGDVAEAVEALAKQQRDALNRRAAPQSST